MPLLEARDVLPFPDGSNETDTIIFDTHFNLTALRHWNYTLYSNDTLSNNSKCYLVFPPHQPVFFSNGSFFNATSCYVPILPVGTRGATGIGFGAAFAVSIMVTLVNLKKHGQLYLREDKRFRVIGRRWQWYWMLFTAACGTVSGITAVDVDRDYVQDIAIILQGFFFFLMVPSTLAIVWEAVRHWGSWQERQIVDAEPFSLRQDDRRGKTEFWLPLVFYMFAWLNFFMTIPRSWSAIEKQRSAHQQETIAKPSATDARMKAASILAAAALTTICFSLHHSLHHYKGGVTRGVLDSFNRFLTHTPAKLFFSIIVLGIKTAYGIVSAWKFDLSVLKYDGGPGWPYGLGYAPVLLVIVILNVFGFLEKNEDLRIMEQRRERGRLADAGLGLVKKPHWWSWGRTELHMTPEQRLRALTHEVGGVLGGKRSTSDQAPVALDSSDIELGNVDGLRDRSRSRQPGDDHFIQDVKTPGLTVLESSAPPTMGGPSGSMRRLAVDRTESDKGSVMTGTSGTTGMTGSTLTGVPAQRIRSMLDV